MRVNVPGAVLLLSTGAFAVVAAVALHGSTQPRPATGVSALAIPSSVPLGIATARQVSSAAKAAPKAGPSADRQLVNKYCVTCHNTRLKTAGLTLDALNIDDPTADPKTWELVVAKLRGGTMPPGGSPRPEESALQGLVAGLEKALDTQARAHPNPGKPVVHRLNRAEYANAIRDILAVDVEVSSLLPPDDSAFGFDNMGEILTVSPGLLERYLTAAEKISRAAVGDAKARPTTETYRVSQNVRQEDRASEDLPFGTRGGIAIRRYFPVDGEYSLKIHMRYATGQDDLLGLTRQTVVETRLDGAKVEEFSFGRKTTYSASVKAYGKDKTPDTFEFRLPVTAGTHVIGVAMQGETLEPEDLSPRFPTSNYSFQNDHLAGARLDFVELGGPYNARVNDSPSRRLLFVCQPTGAADETCAKAIVSKLARRAFRRPVAQADIEPLMQFFRGGAAEGEFDAGVQAALERVLVSPQFLFRAERVPASAETSSAYRVSDIELASRLSFFLWSSIPDDELLDLAVRGTLHTPQVMSQQVRRMVSDRRSKALVSNFAGQWLQLRDIQLARPDPKEFPEFDDELRDAFQTETELLFESQLQENRSVVDLLRSNYTFVNERLARHYGMPNVYGSHFRRVTLTDPNRMGLLGQSSILTVTSYANRTSPTLRGKWVLQNVLGAPPPAPPPDVPALDEPPGVKFKTMRERMDQHRKNPMCASCHARIDPPGFALENFDAVGQWRTHQGETPIDASGSLDGTKFNGIAELRTILLNHRQEFVATATKKLLTYALGRGIDYYDMPAVRGVLRQSEAEDYHWQAIIVGIANSTPFQMRRGTS